MLDARLLPGLFDSAAGLGELRVERSFCGDDGSMLILKSAATWCRCNLVIVSTGAFEQAPWSKRSLNSTKIDRDFDLRSLASKHTSSKEERRSALLRADLARSYVLLLYLHLELGVLIVFNCQRCVGTVQWRRLFLGRVSRHSPGFSFFPYYSSIDPVLLAPFSYFGAFHTTLHDNRPRLDFFLWEHRLSTCVI